MSVVLRLRFEEEKYPFLLDITSLLYDLELTHDLSVLLAYGEYSDFKFTRFFYYRKGRPLKPQHRLRAFRIIKESPLVLEVVFGAIGALWMLVQITDKVRTWSLNKKKLRLEVEKLQYELNIRRIEEEKLRAELETKLHTREAAEILSQILSRLESNPIKLVDLEIRTIETQDDS